MATCRSLTENGTDLKKIGELFLTLQTSATPTSLLLPWLPSRARRTGKEATTELFTMLYSYVEARRTAELTSDTVDFLIAEGETSKDIVEVSPCTGGPVRFYKVRSDRFSLSCWCFSLVSLTPVSSVSPSHWRGLQTAD